MSIPYKEVIKKSAAVILEYQHESGAYPASPTFAVYNYSWLRDGSFTADAMSRAGEIESAEKFFDWCSKVILGQREAIYNGALLEARYTYGGEKPQGEWASFQPDGYGTLLWAIKQHGNRHARSVDQYNEMAELVQYYLVLHWNEPCFDWWEERMGHHAASLACVYAGLNAYQNPEANRVKNAIRLDDERTDSSLLACLLFDAVSVDEFSQTLKNIESELVSAEGGVYRYAGDTYYGGGPMVWLRYHITPRVLIGTEMSTYYTSGFDKKTVEITKKGFTPGPSPRPQFNTTISHSDDKLSDVVMNLPVAL